ncbi:hypothetical protein BDZ89DRAFT_1157089 [Hymenopellis radicata]|nr:hypothetical protein BDZ89DRAFT_1157089 [Hymenopellis radicata]
MYDSTRLSIDRAIMTELFEASNYLSQCLPVLVRFMANEYDNSCSTVFPLLQAILANYKHIRKVSSDAKCSFLSSLLEVILTKMKRGSTTDIDDIDEDASSEFEKLRKDLRLFMDSILTVDQELVTDAVRNPGLTTISAYQNGVNLP